MPIIYITVQRIDYKVLDFRLLDPKIIGKGAEIAYLVTLNGRPLPKDECRLHEKVVSFLKRKFPDEVAKYTHPEYGTYASYAAPKLKAPVNTVVVWAKMLPKSKQHHKGIRDLELGIPKKS